MARTRPSHGLDPGSISELSFVKESPELAKKTDTKGVRYPKRKLRYKDSGVQKKKQIHVKITPSPKENL